MGGSVRVTNCIYIYILAGFHYFVCFVHTALEEFLCNGIIYFRRKAAQNSSMDYSTFSPLCNFMTVLGSDGFGTWHFL